MKKIYILIALLSLTLAVFGQFEIQNAIATPGVGKVTITYDLNHPENKTCFVSIEVSSDGGSNYTITPSSLSGDIGVVTPGTGKVIQWLPGQDNMEIGNNYQVRITADDDFGYPVPANFVLVTGGTFNNGTSNVTLSSFYMDKYEITQSGYQAVMGSNPANGYGVGSNYPVYYVSWFNAIEYSNRRSMQEGLTPCYSYSSYGTNPSNWPAGWNTSSANHTNVSCNWSATGYRLPTEMEWMYAAKGGNQSQGYTYSGSNTIGNVAWYYNNSYAMGSSHPDFGTHTVGTKAGNELGLYDLSGNVWEWVWDIYGSYPSGSQNNPTGANSGSYRVFRGGSWNFYASYCSVSSRDVNGAPYIYGDIGFRCVRVSP